MSTELLKRFLQPRRSGAAAAATVVGVVALMAMQNMGTAAARTDAAREEYLEGCLNKPPRACLWINAPDDPDPAKAADLRALVITPGSGPDLDDKTPYGLGKVHGMTAEFTDDVSVGWNFLPYDLCLMDTSDYRDNGELGEGASLRQSDFVFVVRSGKGFSQLGNWNDKIDYYTTAQSGKCPRGGIIFRADTQEIIKRW